MKPKTATRTKITAILLVLLTVTAMLPLSAFADDSASVTEYPLWIGGVRVTSRNCEDIPVQKGKASYDPIQGVLYLENAEISACEVAGSSSVFGIYGDGLVIVYSGVNNIICSGSNPESIGVFCLGDVAFEAANGESELNVTGCSVGICSDRGNIYFSGGKVDLRYSGNMPYMSDFGGVRCLYGSVTVNQGAEIRISQKFVSSDYAGMSVRAYGFYSRGDFKLNPGCSITVGLEESGYGSSGSHGVYSHEGDITIGGDANVVVTTGGFGLYANNNGKVTINGGNVFLSAKYPVFSDGGAVFGGGSVRVAAGEAAVITNGDIEFTEGLLGFHMEKVHSDYARNYGAVLAGYNKEVSVSEELLITHPAGGKVSDDKKTFVDSNGSPVTELEIKPFVSYYISRNNGAEKPFAIDRANVNVIDCAVGETVSLRAVCNSADHWLLLYSEGGPVPAAEYYKESNYVLDDDFNIKEYTVTFSPPDRSESGPSTTLETVSVASEASDPVLPGQLSVRKSGSYMFNTLKGDLTAEIKDVVVPKGGYFLTDLVLKTALGEERYPSIAQSSFPDLTGLSLGLHYEKNPFEFDVYAYNDCPAGDYRAEFTLKFLGDSFNDLTFRLNITVVECRCEIGEGLFEHPEKAATCFAGNIHCWECADCGRLFYDEHGKREITDRDSAFFLAAHDWAEQANDQFLKTPADCDSAAVYHISCRACEITAEAVADWEAAFENAVPGSSDTVTVDGVDFYVLAKKNGRALLLAKDAVGTADTFNSNSNGGGWLGSDIRSWLNREWLDGMTWLKGHAVTTDIKTSAAAENVNGEFLATHDRVFLLTEADVFGTQNGKPALADYFTIKGAKLPAPGGSWVAEYNGSPIDWWLRSPSMFNSTVAGVKTDGSHGYIQKYSSTAHGVRPAVWVEYKTQDKPAAETFTRGDALGHDWGAASYVWAIDKSACTATRVCLRDGCGHEESETAESTAIQTTDPTCTEKGQYTYTATFTKEYFETQYEYKDILPLEGDHEWQLEGWTWDYPNLGRSIAVDDYEAYPEVTLKLKCSKCGDSVSVTVDKPELQLLTEGDACNGGKRSFIATVNYEGVEYSDKNDFETINALGHDWGAATYVWSGDKSACTATRVCLRGCGHKETETASSSGSQTTDPKCGVEGVYTYTAEFTNKAFEKQTETAPVAALAHDYGAPTYVWSTDKSACTATRVCLRGCGHEESETAKSAGSQTTDPKCGVEGVYTYTAEFANKAFEKQTETAPVAALAHDFGAPAYVWSPDKSACTATRVCLRGCGHEETETAKSTGSQTTDPKCGVEGVYTYTAEFTNKAFEKQTDAVPVAALEHDFGAPAYVWSTDKSACTATRVCLRGCGHEESETVESVKTLDRNPDCETGGEYLYTAEFENPAFEKQTNSDEISADGHTPGEAVVENRVEPDCEKAGSYDEVVYCTVCGKELSRMTETVKAKGHTPGEAVVENRVEPGCEHAGSYDEAVYCTVCGKELSRTEMTIEAKGHAWGEAVVENRVEPGCEHAGSYDEVVYCTVCGKELSRTEMTIEAKGHAWGEWTRTKAPTDREEGEDTRVCLHDASHRQTRRVDKVQYTVTIEEDGDNGRGTVTIEPADPVSGDEVVLKPQPDEDSRVISVKIITADGEEIPHTDNGDGTYSFVMPEGDVEIKVEFAPKPVVEINESEGGEVKILPEKPDVGETVVISVAPENGKGVEKVTVTDKNNNVIPVLDNGDGTYSFEMPDADVTVDVVYKAESAPQPQESDGSQKPAEPEKSNGSDLKIPVFIGLGVLLAAVLAVLLLLAKRKKDKEDNK